MHLPPASDNADLSLIRLRTGPGRFCVGDCRTGERTLADTNADMDTGGCGTDADTGLVTKPPPPGCEAAIRAPGNLATPTAADPGPKFCSPLLDSGEHNCLLMCK